MADRDRRPRIDQPREGGRRWTAPPLLTQETFGVVSEKFARFMGTPYFLIGMTLVVALWVLWNTLLPEHLRFDPYAFIFLTLMLSLQASYAAPLILLAQNRQADRDRVALEQDRARDERNLADTEYLTREVAALRLAMRDIVTRDFVRGELRDLLDELEQRGIVVVHRQSVGADPPEGAGERPGSST
ncbi:MAG: DUF1003 domain-containing protein [Dermatophilaceae bacterium]